MDGKEILAQLAHRPAKVVVMRALRLGDLICATPALRSLRASLPLAHITLIGLPPAREFVRRCPALDAFVEFPGYPGVADQNVYPSRTLAFLSQMQAERFDLAIQLHGSGVFSNPFTILLGARYSVGFTRADEIDLGLDFSFPYPSHGREIHRLLSLMRALGAPDTGDTPALTVLPEDRAALHAHPLLGAFLATDRPLIGIHPGAKVATRRWPLERFAAIADHLCETSHAKIVITGGKEEWTMCEQVRLLMLHDALNAAGRTDLGMLAALMEHLHLFISNDSGPAHLASALGPAHLASALGTRSITIFGAANVEDWAAIDSASHRALSIPVSCRPCYLSECPIGYQCLCGITVEDVLHTAEELLARPLSPLLQLP
jgi:ADP-heptose:LPS heptosyltransferase